MRPMKDEVNHHRMSFDDDELEISLSPIGQLS